MAEVFPEARFLHVIRDGRDVALFMRDQEWSPRTVVFTARFWSERVEAGRSLGRTLGPDRYREIHYGTSSGASSGRA